jgi:hypothetical protein
VYGLIKGLQVHLTVFPYIMIEMDIVVIDVSDVWGMLLNRKAATYLGVVYKWIYLMPPSLLQMEALSS